MKKFICDICNEKFKSRTGLKSHKTWVHRKEGAIKTTYCKQCGNPFQHKSYIKRTFCSKNCASTYRNLHNNPMKNPETRAKVRKKRPKQRGANNPHARWAKMSENEIREWFEKYKKSGLSVNKFAREIAHTNNRHLVKALKRFFACEYEAFVEQKFSMASTPYQRGRRFEYRVRDHYKEQGYYVLRSPISRGPADLVAIKKGEILFIQCKLDGALYGKEKKTLIELATSVGAKAILAWRKGRRKLMIEVLN